MKRSSSKGSDKSATRCRRGTTSKDRVEWARYALADVEDALNHKSGVEEAPENVADCVDDVCAAVSVLYYAL